MEVVLQQTWSLLLCLVLPTSWRLTHSRKMSQLQPLNYARHSLRALTLWLFTLPFALVENLKFLTGAALFLISWLLFGVYEIGVAIEDPFQGTLRLSIMCDIVRRDVLGDEIIRSTAFDLQDDNDDDEEDLEEAEENDDDDEGEDGDDDDNNNEESDSESIDGNSVAVATLPQKAANGKDKPNGSETPNGKENPSESKDDSDPKPFE